MFHTHIEPQAKLWSCILWPTPILFINEKSPLPTAVQNSAFWFGSVFNQTQTKADIKDFWISHEVMLTVMENKWDKGRNEIVLKMVFDNQNHWDSGFCPSSRILNIRKHNVSATESVSVLRWGRVDTCSVGSEVMKNGALCDVTPCGSCKNRRFGGT
jgi:hypothetical protein